MSKYIFPLLFSAVAGTFSMSALDVQTSAGSLASQVQNPAEVTELVVSGTVNFDDLKFIDSSMPALRQLDLRNATIAATECNTPGMANAYPANTIPAYTFAGSKIESVVFPATSFALGDGAFSGSAIKTVELPANVTAVGDGCFSGCAVLSSATVRTGGLGVGVFAACPSLAEVTLGAPTAIPANTFSNCTALTAVAGSRNVTSIGSRAFADCQALESFDFGASLTEIGDEAFIGAGLTSVDLTPCAKLSGIGGWAFARMPRLTSLQMAGASEMSEGMVFDCPNLKEFVISGAATEIPDYAYAKNTSIETSSMFSSNITRIGNHSLHGASGIETLTLPANLEYIGDGAMQNMTGLRTLNVMSSTRPEIGKDVWAGINQANVGLYVPEGQSSDYEGADQWKEFQLMGVSGSAETVEGAILDNLKGRFVGDELQLSISGAEIDEISVYDPAGTLLVSGEPIAEFVAIDMAGFQSRVFIVTARLSDGRFASLKIAKR